MTEFTVETRGARPQYLDRPRDEHPVIRSPMTDLHNWDSGGDVARLEAENRELKRKLEKQRADWLNEIQDEQEKRLRLQK